MHLIKAVRVIGINYATYRLKNERSNAFSNVVFHGPGRKTERPLLENQPIVYRFHANLIQNDH